MTPSRHSGALRAAWLYYLQDLTMGALAAGLPAGLILDEASARRLVRLDGLS